MNRDRLVAALREQAEWAMLNDRSVPITLAKNLGFAADMIENQRCGRLEDVIWEVDAQPAADVAPVLHGRWEPCFDENCKCRWGFGKCSNCGQEYYAHAINYYKYCPNCGAKMDGGDNDEAD